MEILSAFSTVKRSPCSQIMFRLCCNKFYSLLFISCLYLLVKCVELDCHVGMYFAPPVQKYIIPDNETKQKLQTRLNVGTSEAEPS